MGQNRKSFIRYSLRGLILVRKVITEEFKTNIVEYYKSNPMTVVSVCTKFDICNPTFYKILKERGVPVYSRQSLFNDGVDENFFNGIDSEVKAYFLGLLKQMAVFIVIKEIQGTHF